MKVTFKNEKEKVQLDCLPNGSTFVLNNNVYAIVNDVCEHLTYTSYIVAMKLADCTLCGFLGDIEVEPCEVEVVVK